MTKREWLFLTLLDFWSALAALIIYNLDTSLPFFLFLAGSGCGIGLMSLARWRDTE